MEIEVGEYIRVDNGIILRYDFIQKNNDEILLGQKGKVYSFEDEEELEDFIKLRIVKHSKNIIDLIEVGDFVNGHLVFDKAPNCVYIEDNQNKLAHIPYTKEKIRSVVTKEQYEQNSFKL